MSFIIIFNVTSPSSISKGNFKLINWAWVYFYRVVLFEYHRADDNDNGLYFNKQGSLVTFKLLIITNNNRAVVPFFEQLDKFEVCVP